jgi:predicted RNase H-like nuclease (RuvC/YqgF family)
MVVIKYYKGKRSPMESLIEHLPTIVAALLVVSGGVFALVRWLFAKEERRRDREQLERDKLAAAKRETEEKIWARANETIDRLREEVKLLICDNEILRKEIAELQSEVHVLTKLLEENSI